MTEPTARPAALAESPPTETDSLPPDTPQVGDLVWDTSARRIGRVMGHVGPYVQLRPPGGGREWDARGPLRPATVAESLSAGAAVANARSRGETP
ncbi:hypothetical protein [Streptomyces sp. NPDC050263]|uniref:hypothetical protein n=1 Tax=Streptomyces sp. NPDC050263 TaxID=3155037 RepID=UPI0034274C97